MANRVVVRLPREPWEIAILIAGALNGVLILLDIQVTPGALEKQLPGWGVTAWAVGLALGSVVALAGILWPRERPSGYLHMLDGEVSPVKVSPLLLEQVGLTIFGGVALAHASAVFFTTHETNALALYEVAMASAAFAQYLRIRKVLRSGGDPL